MKKSIFLAVAAVAMTACSNDVDLGMKDANKQTADNAIGFEVRNSNMSRGTQGLEATGHYNFGVWAYKDLDPTHAIMANYLVGYFGNNVGYRLDTSKQTTYGETVGNLSDLKSRWAYEGLGTREYVNTSNSVDEKYYLSNTDKFYMSNLSTQFLRYWDYSSRWTKFFAYAPYINADNQSKQDINADNQSKQVSFNNETGVMTFPAGSIVAGYDDPSRFEYLCAYKKINNSDNNYKSDVQLTFKHMNSQIRIVFYEDIKGYDVKMLDLKSDAKVGVLAVPAKTTTSGSNTTYSYCDDGIPMTAGSTVTFSETSSPNIEIATPTYYSGGTANNEITETTINKKALVFKVPTANKLKSTKDGALADQGSWSKTVYYGIPHDTSCGLTFRVSFKLTSTTDETINVYNAGVHVDAVNCKWEAGKRYTYVFKITKNATGSTGTDNPPTVDPNPGTGALFPIVFDGITVEDWEPAADSEHDIN